MKRLLILVEGQTEEGFVNNVLAPHLANFGIYPEATLLKTKKVIDGPSFKGGVTSTKQVLTKQVLRDVRLLLGKHAGVTTLIDYYALPSDFPGMATRPTGSAAQRVKHVESAFAAEVNDASFIPHLVLHEYEAWIFSNPLACQWVFDAPVSLAGRLEAIAATAGGAECINEHPSTAPSKRLEKEFPGYQKVLHGPTAVGAIGLQGVRLKCPHAGAWFTRLERL